MNTKDTNPLVAAAICAGVAGGIWGAIHGVEALAKRVGSKASARPALAPSAPSGTVGERTLQMGSTGPAVRIVQNAVGSTVDGVFGAATRDAVKAFQLAHALTQDGVVGTNTWAAIDADTASGGGTDDT